MTASRTVLTAGYAGRLPENLRRLAERDDLIVIDVRYSPNSRTARWSKVQLGRLLGDRYRWLQPWGNRAYRSGGGIVIADWDAGLAIVRDLDRTPLLLCACQNAGWCHRTVLAERLVGLGWRHCEVEIAPLAGEPDGERERQLILPGLDRGP